MKEGLQKIVLAYAIIIILLTGCSTGTKEPLHNASCKGNLEEINRILDEGADINAQAADYYGATPLQMAASFGQKSAAELLIERGADIENQGGQIVGTPLYIAAFDGRTNVAKLLIAKGADVNAIAADGGTPLHAAASRGHVSMVNLLIDNGADINAKKRFGATPLHRAAEFGHADVVEFLINRGANIDDEDLDVAIMLGHKDVAELLQKHGMKSTAKPPNPDSLLLMAVLDNDLEKAKQALEKGAYVNTKEPFSGRAILGLPATEGNLAMVKLLLDYGADIEEGLLTFVASDGQLSVARLLIKNGADVNERDQGSSTPLHYAALQGHLSVAELLIDEGANINAINSQRKTPLDLAVGHNEMIKFLKKCGASEGQSFK